MVSCGFFNSSNGDRKYTAEQVSMIFDYLINDGVLETYGDKFFTTPSTSTLGVVLGSGWAWFNYTWTQSDTPMLFSLAQADPSLDRIDTIYLRVDKRPLQRANDLGLLEGSPGLNPKPRDLPVVTDVYYHPLAYVRVRANVTRIAASDIEILVGKTNAPFITSILQTTDITTLFQGWSEQFGNKMTEWQDGYDDKLAEWEEEIDTLETSLTSNVDALITRGDNQIAAWDADYTAKMTSWQSQFTSKMTSWQSTFDTSIEGWEADFMEWFEHLQTYLSEDVVTNLQYQIDQLGTNKMNTADFQNLKATTAEAQAGTVDTKWMTPAKATNHFDIRKATDAEITAGTVANHWVSPDQVKTKIEGSRPLGMEISKMDMVTWFYDQGTTSNKICGVDSYITYTRNSSGVTTSNGVLVGGVQSTYAFGFFTAPTKFVVLIPANDGIKSSTITLNTSNSTSFTFTARFYQSMSQANNSIPSLLLAIDYSHATLGNIVQFYNILGNGTVYDYGYISRGSLGWGGILRKAVYVYYGNKLITDVGTVSSSSVILKCLELSNSGGALSLTSLTFSSGSITNWNLVSGVNMYIADVTCNDNTAYRVPVVWTNGTNYRVGYLDVNDMNGIVYGRQYAVGAGSGNSFKLFITDNMTKLSILLYNSSTTYLYTTTINKSTTSTTTTTLTTPVAAPVGYNENTAFIPPPHNVNSSGSTIYLWFLTKYYIYVAGHSTLIQDPMQMLHLHSINIQNDKLSYYMSAGSLIFYNRKSTFRGAGICSGDITIGNFMNVPIAIAINTLFGMFEVNGHMVVLTCNYGKYKNGIGSVDTFF